MKAIFVVDRTTKRSAAPGGSSLYGGEVVLFAEAFRLDEDGAVDDTVEDACSGHLERSSSASCREFLQAVAEPVSRTSFIHEYRITKFSLGAAVTGGWSASEVMSALLRYSHTAVVSSDDGDHGDDSGGDAPWAAAVTAFVTSCMSSYDQATVVVDGRHSMLEVRDAGVLLKLLQDRVMRNLIASEGASTAASRMAHQRHSTIPITMHDGHHDNSDRQPCSGSAWWVDAADGHAAALLEEIPEYAINGNTLVVHVERVVADNATDEGDDELPPPPRHRLRVRLTDHAAARMVTERLCVTYNMPTCRRYCYEHDDTVPDISIALKPQCKPRPYQMDAVGAALVAESDGDVQEGGERGGGVGVGGGGGSAVRSGVILLPCGAGKTLVGIILATAVKKRTLIVCAGSVSVEQWKHQLLESADLTPPTDDAAEYDEASVLQLQPPQPKKVLTERPAASGESAWAKANGKRNPYRAPAQRGLDAAPPRIFASTIRQGRPTGAARVACLTGKQKDDIHDDTDIVITTYTMLGVALQHVMRQQNAAQQVVMPADVAVACEGFDRRSSTQSKKRINPKEALFQRCWGLVLLDEVHMAPADVFRSSISQLMCQSVVGLTATYVREDHRIDDIFHVVGPKLYDVSWETLCRQGYLADATCYEVHVPMSADFSAEYYRRWSMVQPGFGNATNTTDETINNKTKNNNASARGCFPLLQLIAAANPNKFLCVLELVARHLHNGGAKILVFCDHIVLLKQYGALLRCPVVCGETPHRDRLAIFSEFQASSHVNVVCISRVGDVSVNLPNANVVIQTSSHGGSRRQEAQRLGRILRPNKSTASMGSGSSSGKGSEAFFYAIVSRDTVEEAHASHRSRFLVDLGYRCRFVTYEPPPPSAVALDAPTTTPTTMEGRIGDAAVVKREALFGDLETERRFVARRIEDAAASKCWSHIYDASKLVASSKWQLHLLTKCVAKWELGTYRPSDDSKRRAVKLEDTSSDAQRSEGGDVSLLPLRKRRREEVAITRPAAVVKAEYACSGGGGGSATVTRASEEAEALGTSSDTPVVIDDDDDDEAANHPPAPNRSGEGAARRSSAAISDLTVGVGDDAVIYHEF